MPLYTRILSQSEYGTVDLIVQTANLLIPIVSVGITNGIIRFGLDKAVRKEDVFSVGITTCLIGFGVFLLFYPLIDRLDFLDGYTVLLYLYVLMSNARSVCSQFVRARNLVRLYSFDGILSTLLVIVFNIIFLVVFGLGITGYILATIMSDFCSAIFLFVTAHLNRYLRFTGIAKGVRRSMIRFSIPMIPSTIFWWITNVSDRYLVSYMINTAANGLYAAAYKVPTIIMLISSIFSDAWQMSAISERDSANRTRFFTTVFSAYQAIVFVAAAGLIAFSKVITKILVSEAFYTSWQYIPILVMATTFACLSTFFSGIYMMEKKSVLTLLTTMLGAISNIIMNILFIPTMGVNGAALATFISYFLVFVVRVITTQRFVEIGVSPIKIAMNLGIISAQSLIMLLEPPYWIAMQVGLVLLMFFINIRAVILAVLKIIRR